MRLARAAGYDEGTMKPTSENLYGAVYAIGMEDFSEPISQDILDRLTKWTIIEIQPDGRPTPTKYGERCFSALESGDWGTPEFDEELNQA